MATRELFSGVLPVLSMAVADWLGGRRRTALMAPLDPAWRDVASMYGESGYANAVLRMGPLAYYRLGESEGTVAADASGNGFHGTSVNSPILGEAGLLAGDADTAYQFDGTNNRKVNFPPLGVTGAHSAVAWFRREGASAGSPNNQYHTVVSGGISGQASYPRILVSSDGLTLLVQVRNSALATTTFSHSFDFGLTTHLVGYTFDGAEIRVYVDGVQVGPTTAFSGTLYAGGSVPGVIGQTGTDNYLTNGVIDEVAIWDRVLTADEFAELYAVGASA